MNLQKLIDFGFVNLVNYNNGLYYLEFTYSKSRFFNDLYGGETEIYNYIGTIICDEEENIYKANLKSYCIVNASTKIYIGFPQLIVKSHNLKLSDIFKIDKNNLIYLNVVSLKDMINRHDSTRWIEHIKKDEEIYTDRMYQKNICTKEYIDETQDKIKAAEFFKNEENKFNILSNAIITGSKNIENGLMTISSSISHSVGKLTAVQAYNGDNHFIEQNGFTNIMRY